MPPTTTELPKRKLKSRRSLARLLRQKSMTVEGPDKLRLRRLARSLDRMADYRGDRE